MKNTIAKLLCLIVAMLMTLPAIACNNKNGNASSNNTSTGPAVYEMQDTESGLKIPKIELTNKVIKFLGIDQPQFREDGVVTSFFNKYYGGTIEVDVTAPADIVTKLSSLILSEDPPDLVSVSGGFPSLPITDMVEPIDGLINFNDDLFKDLKACYEQFIFGDKHYFAPWVYDTLSYVFYNKKIFADNGMKTPDELFNEGKWTWDEFKKAAIDLNVDENGDGTAERWGLATCVYHDIRLAFTTGQNTINVNGRDITSNIANPKLERAFNFLYDLTYKDKVASPNRDSNEVQSLFNTGKTAMLMGPDFWSGDDTAFPDLKKANGFGFAPYPKDPQADNHYIPGEAIGFFVPKGVVNNKGLTAFFYSAVAAMKEEGMKGNPAYQKAYDKFMKKYSDAYTQEDYEKRIAMSAKINSLPRIVDSYRDLVELDSMYGEMIGLNGAGPLTYKAVVAKVEPGVLEIIKNLFATPVESADVSSMTS